MYCSTYVHICLHNLISQCLIKDMFIPANIENSERGTHLQSHYWHVLVFSCVCWRHLVPHLRSLCPIYKPCNERTILLFVKPLMKFCTIHSPLEISNSFAAFCPSVYPCPCCRSDAKKDQNIHEKNPSRTIQNNVRKTSMVSIRPPHRFYRAWPAPKKGRTADG